MTLTLNGHFALNSVSGSASNGLTFWPSDKTVLKFADLSIYCRQQKCSAGTLVTGDMFYEIIHSGSVKRERQVELYSQLSRTHATA